MSDCLRCGKCCMSWREGNNACIFGSPKVWEIYEKHQYNWAIRVTQDQLENLYEENKKFYHHPDWCGMLIKEGDKCYCIIHKLYGKDAKPLECVGYGELNCMSRPLSQP